MAYPTPPALCAGCGSTLRPGTKFCENCGAPAQQAAAACGRCGNRVGPGARFCGSCGAPVAAAAGAAAPQPAQAPHAGPPPRRQEAAPPPAQPAEPILAVIPTLGLRKGLLNLLEYNLLVTPQRLVFARVTQKMIGDAAMVAKQVARDQGKGFMGQWGAVIGARQYLCDQYRLMSVDAIVAQDRESFFFPLGQVSEIRCGSDSDADDNTTEWMQVRTTMSKLRFTLPGGGADHARELLRPILGDLVR